MKLLNLQNKRPIKNSSRRDWRAFFVLIAGLILAIAITLFTNTVVEKQAKDEFISICKEIEIKIATRLQAHVLILRAGTALFAVSDTVTRNEWKEFIDRSQIEKTLPGIQGVGLFNGSSWKTGWINISTGFKKKDFLIIQFIHPGKEMFILL